MATALAPTSKSSGKHPKKQSKPAAVTSGGRRPRRTFPQNDSQSIEHLMRRGPAPIHPSLASQAQTIHLPNIVFRLIRNSPREAKNPYLATFRVPVQLTKPDIVNYLQQVYGLKAMSINTIIEMGERVVRPGKYKSESRKQATKKAIIGLEDPFWYPEKRSQQWLDDFYEVTKRKDYLTRRLLPIGDGGPGRGRRSWRWRGSSVTQQGMGARYSSILQRIKERRAQQEQAVDKLANRSRKSMMRDRENIVADLKALEV